jgi:hypothetical protein
MLNPAIDKVLDRCALVVVTTRMPSPMRDTDEGSKSGSRVVKVLQSCFNPEALRPLNKLKTHATRACRAVGTRLDTLQAWTVVTENLDGLMKELERIHQDWQIETKLLAKSIGTRVEEWAAMNPSESVAIKSLAPTSREILASSKFLRTSFRLRSEDIIDQEAVEEEMTSLVGKVLYEMSLILRDASLHKSKGAFFTPDVFDVLARVREKCKAMAFLDPLLQRISATLEDFHHRLAGQGRITDLDALALHALIQQLLDTRGLLRSGLVVPQIASATSAATTAPAATPQATTATATAPRKQSKPKAAEGTAPSAAQQNSAAVAQAPDELEAACLI